MSRRTGPSPRRPRPGRPLPARWRPRDRKSAGGRVRRGQRVQDHGLDGGRSDPRPALREPDRFGRVADRGIGVRREDPRDLAHGTRPVRPAGERGGELLERLIALPVMRRARPRLLWASSLSGCSRSASRNSWMASRTWPLRPQRAAQRVVGRGQAGVDGERAPIVRHRFVELSLLLERASEVEVRRGAAGPEPHRFAEVDEAPLPSVPSRAEPSPASRGAQRSRAGPSSAISKCVMASSHRRLRRGPSRDRRAPPPSRGRGRGRGGSSRWPPPACLAWPARSRAGSPPSRSPAGRRRRGREGSPPRPAAPSPRARAQPACACRARWDRGPGPDESEQWPRQGRPAPGGEPPAADGRARSSARPRPPWPPPSGPHRGCPRRRRSWTSAGGSPRIPAAAGACRRTRARASAYFFSSTSLLSRWSCRKNPIRSLGSSLLRSKPARRGVAASAQVAEGGQALPGLLVESRGLRRRAGSAAGRGEDRHERPTERVGPRRLAREEVHGFRGIAAAGRRARGASSRCTSSRRR